MNAWHITQGSAKTTTRSNLYGAMFYARWCDRSGVDLWAATTEDVTAFIAWYSEQAGQYSVIRRLTSIKALYAFAVATGRSPTNPASSISVKLPVPAPKRPFTEGELRRILAATRGQRERALMFMFIDCGVRLSEAAGMDVEDIDWENGLVLVTGKGRKERYLHPGARALAALRRYVGDRSGPVWLSAGLRPDQQGQRLSVPSIYRIVKDVAARAGVAKAYPHRFRTTFACMFHGDSHGDIQSLMMLMGHTKVATTLAYSRWSAAQQALQQQARYSLGDRISV
ncbi:hypothetical protein LCGC14_1214990 [marine sediment metagenome]|uniref:Tyr recombinase domain-containing protein n=1 Tax=marine sediment metagenome TaxID=412755 RepID=A0A0F9LH65_9ZZZZ